MAGRFVPDPNFDKALRSNAQVRRARIEAGQAIVDAAAREVSVRTGGLRESLGVRTDGDGVHAGSDSPFWHLEEYGSINQSASAPLRRAVAAAGYRLEEDRR